MADVDTLWALQTHWSPFEEIACEYVMDELPAGTTIKRGAKRFYPSLVAKALGSDKPDNALTPAYDGDGYGDKAADGALPSYWGEHWGKTIEMTGGYDGLLFVTWCDGGYGCGAHGNTDCTFAVFPFGREGGVDLVEAQKELAPAAKSMLDGWLVSDEELTMTAELGALEVRYNDGVVLEYRYVADVPYVATDGNWGSYTQSRTLTAPPVAALKMPALPAALATWLATQPKDSTFGWSTVPSARRAAIEAFKDPATLAKPRPADVVPADGDAANAKLAEGRKATKEKRYADAIAAFDAAIAASDKLARAWSGRGYAKLLAGELDAAKADFDKALGLDAAPKFQAAVYYNLGELALAQKDRAAAKEAFTKANTLSPSDAAKKQLERLP